MQVALSEMANEHEEKFESLKSKIEEQKQQIVNLDKVNTANVESLQQKLNKMSAELERMKASKSAKNWSKPPRIELVGSSYILFHFCVHWSFTKCFLSIKTYFFT